MNNVVNLTCLSCCPIVISNSQSRQVADVTTQSGSDAFVTGSLVYAGNQVNQMQKFEGQASEGLFNQGQEMAGVSRFVNRVELEQLKTSMVERSNSSITQGGDDGKNDEVAGRESPPPPPPPPPPRPIDNDDVNPVLSLYESQINPEEKGRPDSPPPPPPRINYPQSERSVSPPPLPQGDTMSQGFYSFGSADQTTGGRLDTVQVQNEKSTLTEELRGQSPLPEIDNKISSPGFMSNVAENNLNGVVIEYKTWETVIGKPSSEPGNIKSTQNKKVPGIKRYLVPFFF